MVSQKIVLCQEIKPQNCENQNCKENTGKEQTSKEIKKPKKKRKKSSTCIAPGCSKYRNFGIKGGSNC
jgi:hypothetical protein